MRTILEILLMLLSAMNIFSKTDAPDTPEARIHKEYLERIGKGKKTDPPPPAEPPEKKNPLENLIPGKTNEPPPEADKTEEEMRKKFWSEHFGDQPIETVKQSLGKLSEYEKEMQRLKEFESKYGDLEKKHTEMQQQVHFTNDRLFRLDKLYAQNPTEAEIVERVIHNGASPMDILMAEFMIKNPEFKDKPDEAKQLIISKGGYDIDYEDEDTDDDELNEKAKIINKRRKEKIEANMKFDSIQAKKEILKKLESIELPKKMTAEEIKAAETKKINDLKKSKDNLVEKWKEPFAKTINSTLEPENVSVEFKNETFEINGKQIKIPDGKFDFDFKIPDSELQDIGKVVVQIIDMNNYDPTPENIGNIVSLARNSYFLSPDGKKEIVRQVARKLAIARSMTDDEYKNFIHNPSTARNNATPPGIGGNVSKREASLEKAAKALGG
uniref:Uncharacterized protein n=1 Tax=viral metagenome TaxID=1070528 RepID=A0A6M3J137_9ZZZZ